MSATAEPPRIILASGSAIRAAILTGARVPFEVMKPDVDESVIKKQALAEGLGLEDLAMRLAEAKCMDVAARTRAIVIGADQIMEFEGRAYDKPASIDEARARFLAIAGAPHTLINAIAVARNGAVIWRHLARPTLHVRPLTDAELDAYFAEAAPDILNSVGAYQIEDAGARLFDRIEGDHFAVLGLALTPLLAFLRREGALAY